MKSKILDGILVQHDGRKCYAKIRDIILKKEMIISAKKKKKPTKTRIRYKQAIKKNTWDINIKANGFKMKGWK